MNINPFFHGNPVAPKDFINHKRPIRRIVGRIINQGQSSALIGEPRTGKSSLLRYLKSAETHEKLYSQHVHVDQLIFSELDMHTTDRYCTAGDSARGVVADRWFSR
ncbi:hypothetical protein QUF63_06520 [Anaerolineales bacterium HSG25]|nr:hypothetical protein [Anaerolineales bacterium HSG25]